MAQSDSRRRPRQPARDKPRPQRVFDPAFKENAVRRMLAGENVARLSRELDVGRNVLYRWRDAYRGEGRAGLSRPRGRPPGGSRRAPPPASPAEAAQARIAELERLVGKQAAELRFFEKAFAAVSALPGTDEPGTPRSTASSAKRSSPEAPSPSSKPVS